MPIGYVCPFVIYMNLVSFVNLRSLVDQNRHNFIPPTSRMTNYVVLRFGSTKPELIVENNIGLLRSDIAWTDAKYAQIWEYMRDEFELTHCAIGSDREWSARNWSGPPMLPPLSSPSYANAIYDLILF
ncbi:hypothetical protein Hanom_Chr08g00726161 [Helianthus anomalus]